MNIQRPTISSPTTTTGMSKQVFGSEDIREKQRRQTQELLTQEAKESDAGDSLPEPMEQDKQEVEAAQPV